MTWARTGTAVRRRRVAFGNVAYEAAAGLEPQLAVHPSQVHGDAAGVVRHLRPTDPGAYRDLGRFVVACASPELFLERRGDQVLLRPMTGTARRVRHRDEDRRLADELRSSAEDRAANVLMSTSCATTPPGSPRSAASTYRRSPWRADGGHPGSPWR